MNRFVIISLIIFELLSIASVSAQNFSAKVTGPAPTESKHKINSKPDSTGGLQIPGGIYSSPDLSGVGIDNLPAGANVLIPVSKKDLDPYRGPDVLNPCAYFASSLVTVDDCVCEKIMQQISSSSGGGGNGSGSTSSSSSSSSSGSGSTSSSSSSSSSGSGSTSSSSSSSSSGSSSGGPGVQCPPSPLPPTNLPANLPFPANTSSSNFTECTYVGQTCAGHCETDPTNGNAPAGELYQPVSVYRVIDDPNSTILFKFLSVSCSGYSDDGAGNMLPQGGYEVWNDNYNATNLINSDCDL